MIGVAAAATKAAAASTKAVIIRIEGRVAVIGVTPGGSLVLELCIAPLWRMINE